MVRNVAAVFLKTQTKRQCTQRECHALAGALRAPARPRASCAAYKSRYAWRRARCAHAARLQCAARLVALRSIYQWMRASFARRAFLWVGVNGGEADSQFVCASETPSPPRERLHLYDNACPIHWRSPNSSRRLEGKGDARCGGEGVERDMF